MKDILYIKSDEEMIIVELIFNLTLLVSVSVLSGFIDNRWKRDTHTGSAMQGILFGLVALVGMLNPFVLAPGIIFDGRSVVLSLCGLFFGPVAGIIAALIALAYRLAIGGAGVYMGTAVILSSTFIGVLFHRYASTSNLLSKTGYLYFIGLIVHVTMFVLIFAIPSPMRNITYKTLTLSILGIYPLATVLIGKILKDQADSFRHKIAEEALRESENKFAMFMEHLPAFAFMKDDQCRSIYYNKAMVESLGANQWLGMTAPEYFHGELGAKMLADDRMTFASGYHRIEDTIPDLKGEMRVFETHKFIIPRKGKAPYLGGIAIDITERLQAIATIREKVHQLEQFNNLMIGRELKMVELKKEINALLASQGIEGKYNIHE